MIKMMVREHRCCRKHDHKVLHWALATSMGGHLLPRYNFGILHNLSWYAPGPFKQKASCALDRCEISQIALPLTQGVFTFWGSVHCTISGTKACATHDEGGSCSPRTTASHASRHPCSCTDGLAVMM